MDPNHLHLHVRDTEAARRFYETHFGLTERIRHGEILFMTGPGGFDLALAPDPAPTPLPDWFHFGFRLPNPEAVRRLHASMLVAGVRMQKPLLDDPDLVSYRCVDPDGYSIEVYWE